MCKYQRAFTLIELLITLVIVAILLGLAAPSFQAMTANNRVNSASEELATAFNYARSEAVRRGSNVAVCASSDGQTCGMSWNDGFIVVVDLAPGDRDPAVVLGDVLRAWNAGRDGLQTNDLDNVGRFVRFLSTGARANINNREVSMAIFHNDCSGDNAMRIVGVAFSGAVSVNQAPCL